VQLDCVLRQIILRRNFGSFSILGGMLSNYIWFSSSAFRG